MSEVESKKKLRFFGTADRDKDGNIKSAYPTWYHRQHVEDLEESIRIKERTLAEDLIPDTEKPLMRQRLKQEKDLMNKIDESREEIKGYEDTISKGVKELTLQVKDMMFTRSEMEKGLADAHTEATRLSEPCIEIKSREVAELAEAVGVKIKDGKISRGQAEKIWKIGRRALGEISNVEVMRKG